MWLGANRSCWRKVGHAFFMYMYVVRCQFTLSFQAPHGRLLHGLRCIQVPATRKDGNAKAGDRACRISLTLAGPTRRPKQHYSDIAPLNLAIFRDMNGAWE